MRQKRIDEAIARIQDLVGSIYEAQLGPKKKFDFKWEDIRQRNNKTALQKLNTYLVDAGVGSLKLDELMAEYIFSSSLAQRLNELVKCKARCYILEGFNFARRDLFSDSDPYLIVKCGNSVFNEQKDYQLDTSWRKSLAPS